jgi:hypothetical protein
LASASSQKINLYSKEAFLSSAGASASAEARNGTAGNHMAAGRASTRDAATPQTVRG